MLIALLLAASVAAAPHADRVAETGRVWAAARYYHPYSLTRDLDWDAMLIDALKEVQKAESDEQEAAAIRAMLARIGDPVTTVHHPVAAPPAVERPKEVPMKSENGTLTIDLRQYAGYWGFAALRSSMRRLHDRIANAGSVTFDLRAAADEDGNLASFDQLFDGLAPVLTNKPVAPPPQRFVIRSGYPPQTGGSSGGYYAAVGVLPAKTIDPEKEDAAPKKITFLVNATTSTPLIALALRDSGIATIDGPVITGEDAMPVPLHGGYLAMIRTTEVGGNELTSHGGVDQPHREMNVPPLEWRWLAVIRCWAVIHYFYPYLNLIGDWDAVLPEYLTRMENVSSAEEYARTLLEMVTHVSDQHVNIAGNAAAFSITGVAWLPLDARFIEGKLVVTQITNAEEGGGIKPGDVIAAIDGTNVSALVTKLETIAPASTPAGRMARIANLALRGATDSKARLTIESEGSAPREVELTRAKKYHFSDNDPPYRILDGNIGYADLRRLERAQVDAMFDALWNTKAIIFDMRGYPRGTAWAIAPRLNTRGAHGLAEFHRPELSGMSSFPLDISFKQDLPPATKPLYRNPTVMLVDERTISQAEHTGLFFEAANGTKFIGSQTAGTNGDVTTMMLPGGITVSFTGHDVRHFDGRQLQRIGLVPEVEVKPTIAGIRAGRDEVLERAIAYVNSH